ncbi:hypothetical protein Fmac_001579 [Flemingia macrophylla]|uniref:RRM domain-containing protein n=1 Tax=Flemingia macrophylla TaxID=520843 RepID=A0ABD1NHK4_9FABA
MFLRPSWYVFRFCWSCTVVLWRLGFVGVRVSEINEEEAIYDKTTRRSKGFGFVTVSSVEEVEVAAYSRGGGGFSDSENRVHVGNLAWGVDNLALESLFCEQQKFLEARVIYDRESRRSRGFGFVTYNSPDEVNSAIQSLDGVARGWGAALSVGGWRGLHTGGGGRRRCPREGGEGCIGGGRCRGGWRRLHRCLGRGQRAVRGGGEGCTGAGIGGGAVTGRWRGCIGGCTGGAEGHYSNIRTAPDEDNEVLPPQARLAPPPPSAFFLPSTFTVLFQGYSQILRRQLCMKHRLERSTNCSTRLWISSRLFA